MVHSFQSCSVRGLDCLKAFQSLSPPPISTSQNKINPTRFLSISSMCDRNRAWAAGSVPGLSASPREGEGAGEGCLLDQHGWEGMQGLWGYWGVALALPAPQRSGRAGCCHLAGASRDRARGFASVAAAFWGSCQRVSLAAISEIKGPPTSELITSVCCTPAACDSFALY